MRGTLRPGRRLWDDGLTVGQAAVPDKGNALTALRQRLPALALEDRVVSIDAAGGRKDIARTIAAAGGGYLLAVKDNESHLHAHLPRDFAYLDRTGAVAHDRCKTVTRGQGRIERRTCTIMGGDNGILDEIDPDHRWTALGCVVRVVAERTVRGRTTRAVRYDITNLPVDTGAARMADLVRGHWEVENSLHGVLDDTFQEDRCRPAHRPCRPQQGRPAAHRLALPDASHAVFRAQHVNAPAAQDGDPQPRPAEADPGPVTTLSTPCGPAREHDPAGSGCGHPPNWCRFGRGHTGDKSPVHFLLEVVPLEMCSENRSRESSLTSRYGPANEPSNHGVPNAA